MTVTADDLPAILANHRKWLRGEDGGVRADLARANLAGANLDHADLARAYLDHANLAGANLDHANLADANLDHANLARAYLAGADLDHANLAGANLAGANLDHASLARAYLDHADLAGTKWDADGVIKTTLNPVMFNGATWPVMVFDRHIKIGCQVHTTEEWRGFSDREIARMDPHGALTFWEQWKTVILAMADAHQSKVEVTK